MKDRPPLPWRVFGVIGLLIVVTAFSALNLENRSDVSLGVYTFRGAPVFLTSLIALILGALLVVPLTLRKGVRRPVAAAAADEDVAVAAEPLPDDTPQPDAPRAEPEPENAPRRRRRWPFGARHRNQGPEGAPLPGRGDGGDRDTGGGG